MSDYLARHYDAGLDLEQVGSREELEQKQVERLARALSVVILAGTMPRRLGADATPEELAVDKKRARRTGHAIGQSLKQWTKRKQALPLDEAVRREGAQIRWDPWIEAYLTELRTQLRCVATYAIRSQEERWGKSAVVRLENELKWIEFAMRD